MPKLKKVEDAGLVAWLTTHAGWSREGETLVRTFSFPDYPRTIAFVVRLGFAAEKRDHHPDLSVHWGKVVVRWSTHDSGGITELDLELASRTDELSTHG